MTLATKSLGLFELICDYPYNNEKQILLSIHYQNNFDYLLIC